MILGSASSGRHRPRAAYDTTVETSIACGADSVGRGIGTRLYQALFAELAHEDIHRLVAGVAQPNDASNALHRKLGFVSRGSTRRWAKVWQVLGCLVVRAGIWPVLTPSLHSRGGRRCIVLLNAEGTVVVQQGWIV